MPPTIAYMMSRFPHLSETFILREMTELEQHGWQVALYPLLLQHQPVMHTATRAWLPRIRPLPVLSSRGLKIQCHAICRQPRVLGQLWQQMVREHLASPSDLARALALFPKAVVAAQRMQQEGIRHIHAHYATYPALVAWLIHHLTGISYSVTVHAHDIFVRSTMLATKLRDAAFIVSISNYNRDYLTRTVGPWIPDKTHIIHCGITPSHYTPLPTTTTRRSNTHFELMSIGSLQPYKGYCYLLQACTLLRDRGIPLHCRIIGGGAEHATLSHLISANRLDGMVELAGPLPQEDIAALLPTAHCYVQPSIITPSGKMEGIPVALMEALASGLPVVATKLSGIPELVQPHVTGHLVPPADPYALADAMEAIYRDPASAAQMAQNGRNRVRQEFDLETNVARLATLFNRTIQQQRHHEKTDATAL